MPLIAIVTTLLLLQYFIFGILVGGARGKTGVAAPAISGHPIFENYFRAHQNTMEQLIIVIPALWIFGSYVSELYGAIFGMVFFIGRILYFRGYVQDPKKRELGFIIGAVAMGILLIGGLIAAVMAYWQYIQAM
ncbi:MAG: MAPEG family protein [Cellvibrionaceae bacterium]